MDNITPVFLTGTFRSGTTLMSQILKANPEINFSYDTLNFMRFCYNRYNPIIDINNTKLLISDCKQRLLERWSIEIDEEEILKGIGEKKSYSVIYNAIMEQIFKNSPKKSWGEKTVLAWRQIPGFFDMFPNGKVIHIVRDPRAVLYSWKKMTTSPGLAYLEAVFNCFDSMKKGREYNEEYDSSKYFLVKYEDLVEAPERVVTDLCLKLDIVFSKEMLDTDNYRNKKDMVWEGNSVHSKKISDISVDMVNLWQKGLSDEEISFVELFCLEEMKFFDYPNTLQNRKQASRDEIKKVLEIVKKSGRLMECALDFSFLNEGIQRFPTDPLRRENWTSEEINGREEEK